MGELITNEASMTLRIKNELQVTLNDLNDKKLNLNDLKWPEMTLRPYKVCFKNLVVFVELKMLK